MISYTSLKRFIYGKNNTLKFNYSDVIMQDCIIPRFYKPKQGSKNHQFNILLELLTNHQFNILKNHQFNVLLVVKKSPI